MPARMNKMYVLRLLLWIYSAIPVVSSKFSCLEMKQFCSCSVETEWWLHEWTDLKIVNCSYRSLSEVPNLTKLRDRDFHKLLLNNNNITEISDEDFKNLSVREVVLRKNPIKRISNDAFSSIRHSVEILNLDSDKIKLDEGLTFLRGLYNLKQLDLGYNQLKDRYKVFPANLFANLNLSSLNTLTLQSLLMSDIIEGAFIGIENLEQLDLSSNYLFKFPTEVLRLRNLKGLKLYSNELITLKNNTFTGLKHLSKLLIGVNEITAETMEMGIFHDQEESMIEINLYQNPLYRVPKKVLKPLKNLKKLSLVKTNLEVIPNGTFVGEYRLKELHLDDNKKLKFEDDGMFHGIEESLEVLFIRSLNLSKLPLNVLERLKNLYHLDATDNVIRKVDKHFFDGLKLSEVNLMWNNITNVDHRAFRHFDKGVILNLHHNSIKNISFILQVEQCTFKEIYLTGNKIPCDCTVEKVLHSGLVSWQTVGECHLVKTDGTDGRVVYNFKDEELHSYLVRTCGRTKPSANCNPTQSSRTNNSWSLKTSMIFSYSLAVLSIIFMLFV
ncbi:Toll-like receptor [Mactra antiquata]